MTVQTAVLIETLVSLGAEVRWASCNIFSTQDHAAAAVVVGPHGTEEEPKGVPVLRLEGRDAGGVLVGHRADAHLAGADPGDAARGPNMILDDGGDATLLVHKGVEFEATGVVPTVDDDDPRPSDEYRIILDVLRRSLAADPQRWTRVAAEIRGVTEETTTGVHRLYQLAEQGLLLFPAINVNDSVTKSKFDNIYGIRHSLIDGLNRATDVLIGGKVALVCGFGDVGKGAAAALAGQGARVIVSEVDPICALQALLQGFQVARLEDVIDQADIVVTTTGNKDIVTVDAMARMKHQAIVANVGHFDNEIDMAGLARYPGVHPAQHQAAGRRVALPGRPLDHRAVRGPADEPGQRHRAPVVRDEQQLLQPGDRPGRAVHQARGVQQGRLPAAEEPRREGRQDPRAGAGRRADQAHQGPGRVHRRGRRGPVQARALPILRRAWTRGQGRCSAHERPKVHVDGDGWTRCALGHRHWGATGRPGCCSGTATRCCCSTGRVWSHHGGTWGLLGGARHRGETAEQAAAREAAEEAGSTPARYTVIGQYVDDHGGWSYTTVVGRAPTAGAAGRAHRGDRRGALGAADELPELPLHPGFAATWDRVRATADAGSDAVVTAPTGGDTVEHVRRARCVLAGSSPWGG